MVRLSLRALCSSKGFKYWDRWVDRETFSKQRYRKWCGPLVGWKEIDRHWWSYNEHRPWTAEFQEHNRAGKNNKRYFVEPIKDWSIFKGDRVQVLVGKDAGKQGIINYIVKERNWCFVEGLNLKYVTVGDFKNQPPRMMADERPLRVTDQIRLVDPSDNEPCEVEWRYTEDGEKVRVSTKSGRVIPMPLEASETPEGVKPSTYTDGTKDTTSSDAQEITFEPKLKTFEQDIMDTMGIVETRKRQKTYWY